MVSFYSSTRCVSFLGTFRKRHMSHERKVLSEKKSVPVILKILLFHVFNKPNFSDEGHFDTGSETRIRWSLSILDIILVIADLSDFMRALTDLSLDDVLYVQVQWIQIWWARRPCVMHPPKRCRVLLEYILSYTAYVVYAGFDSPVQHHLIDQSIDS